tara:strand:- start:1704 stop:2093 length:390 start_codon:yes stop_codon:yes gene_type:complete
MSCVDSVGCIRIARDDRKILRPCKCTPKNGACCHKNYCPCRKAGFYCGDSCRCRCNSIFPCANDFASNTSELENENKEEDTNADRSSKRLKYETPQKDIESSPALSYETAQILKDLDSLDDFDPSLFKI